ncbi:gamma carbonic anhydrase family protein [Parasphingorhabdus pacifica]
MIAADAWVAPGATLVGDVHIGRYASVWYGTILRADQDRISVGDRTNIQDGTVMHADPGVPLLVGDRVSVGHGAILHGCEISNDVLIGMRATVLNGTRVGAASLVAAGAVVLEGTDVPPRSLVAGIPGRVRRELTDEEVAGIVHNSTVYVELSERYASSEFGEENVRHPPTGGPVSVR